MNKILEHETQDLTITCEAGATIADLDRAVAAHGQRLAIEVPFPGLYTIGGVVANRLDGFIAAAYGSLSHQILGMRVALSTGDVVATGGRVVKNVTGYDMGKVFTGSHGSLGVITSLTFRLRALPPDCRTLVIPASTPGQAMATAMSLRDLPATISGLALAGGAASQANDGSWAVFIRMEGHPSTLDDTTERVHSLENNATLVDEPADTWKHLTEFPHLQTFAARLALRPSRMEMALERLEHAAESAEYGCVADMMNGVLHFTLPTIHRDVDTTCGELTLSAIARDLEAVISIPTDANDHAERFNRFGGPDGPSMTVMNRIKSSFDPSGLMNRGRNILGHPTT